MKPYTYLIRHDMCKFMWTIFTTSSASKFSPSLKFQIQQKHIHFVFKFLPKSELFTSSLRQVFPWHIHRIPNSIKILNFCRYRPFYIDLLIFDYLKGVKRLICLVNITKTWVLKLLPLQTLLLTLTCKIRNTPLTINSYSASLYSD